MPNGRRAATSPRSTGELPEQELALDLHVCAVRVGDGRRNGVDVAGSLGKIAATGTGQTLKAANGLAVNVLGGALGDRGNISFTRGIAVQLDSLLSKALGQKGSIASSTSALEAQNKDMDKQKARINSQLEEKEKRYLKQFNSLDSMISNMSSTMAYLSQQLSALNNNNK